MQPHRVLARGLIAMLPLFSTKPDARRLLPFFWKISPDLGFSRNLSLSKSFFGGCHAVEQFHHAVEDRSQQHVMEQ